MFPTPEKKTVIDSNGRTHIKHVIMAGSLNVGNYVSTSNGMREVLAITRDFRGDGLIAVAIQDVASDKGVAILLYNPVERITIWGPA